MKILIIGSGGREHALIWKISQSPRVSEIYCVPGNAGISQLAQCFEIKEDNFKGLINLVQERKIDLTIVGPELPLSQGIVDEFNQLGFKIFGPCQRAAQIEFSKIFAKDFMKKYNIPSSHYAAFQDYQKALDYLKQQRLPLVIKADGLAAGKGVFIVKGFKQGKEVLNSLMNKKILGEAGLEVIIEEFLIGEELSVLAFSDGETVLPMLPSQDHKKIFNYDRGPNTGGMGAYSPVPFYDNVTKEIVLQKILKPTIEGLKKEGREYKGVLYAGLILTEEGPKVLEFNARFGDPETQVILPSLETDLIDIFNVVVEGELHKIDLKWKDQAVVCVVIASRGYPGKYQKGKVINGLESLKEMGQIIVFHAGTKFQEEKIVTSGGRVLGITAWADTTYKAKEKAYEGVKEIYFEEMYYRKDIALKGIK